MMRFACAVLITSGLLSMLTATAVAQGLLGYHVILEQPAPALPLTVGVDDGSGFVFDTLTDDDGDGLIELPRVPIPGRLALGVTPSVGSVPGCDIWDLMGGVVTDRSIDIPLMFLAGGVEGELGIDYGELMAPPLPLTSGQQFQVIDGMLPGWPDIRLVDESGVPNLATFVQVVDTLPEFTGGVLVSASTVHFSLVPEPSTLLMLLFASALLLSCGRWSRLIC